MNIKDGVPEINLTIEKWINTNISTAAIMVNSINNVLMAGEGLKIMIRHILSFIKVPEGNNV